MEDKSIIQSDKPGFSQEKNQQLNAPPVSQPYMPPQISQPYIVQLPNQQYIIPNQPYLINSYTNIYDLPSDKKNLTGNVNLKRTLCCSKTLPWALIIVLILGGFISLESDYIPIKETISCVIVFIVGFFVYQSFKSYDVKKYNIALILYSIYFFLSCVACLLNIFVRAEKYGYSSNSDNFIAANVIEILFELMTLFFLWCAKKDFKKLENNENHEPATQQEIQP